jgi:predicted DNA-binding transcriptional regulator
MGTRSSVAQLPEQTRTELERRLVQSGFSGYLDLAEWLKGQGFEISKSAIHRYGSAFEERIQMMRAATQGALEMRNALGDDDEAAMAQMSLQMAQGLIFQLMIERGEELEAKEISLITRALSDSSRAGIGVKKYQQEVKAKAEAKFAELERTGTGLDAATLKRVREEIYGLF